MHGHNKSTNNNRNTHTAYLYKRTGKRQGVLLECGSGRLDRERNCAEVFLDRTPIGGWTGYLLLSPHNVTPAVEPFDDEEDEETTDGATRD